MSSFRRISWVAILDWCHAFVCHVGPELWPVWPWNIIVVFSEEDSRLSLYVCFVLFRNSHYFRCALYI